MQFDERHRREFPALLGGAAAWPLPARTRQGERMRASSRQQLEERDTEFTRVG